MQASLGRRAVTIWRRHDPRQDDRGRPSDARADGDHRLRADDRHHHVPGSRLHRAGGAAHQRRSRPDAGADGLGLRRLQLGLRPLRGARRLARRPDRAAARAHARRALVVVLHGRDRLGVERAVAHRDARAVRRGRGRLLSEPDPHLHDLPPGGRPRARPGAALVLRALERRVHPAARRLHPRVHELAEHLRALRACRA